MELKYNVGEILTDVAAPGAATRETASKTIVDSGVQI